MADNNKQPAKPAGGTLETGMGTKPNVAVDMGDYGQKPKATSTDPGATADVGVGAGVKTGLGMEQAAGEPPAVAKEGAAADGATDASKALPEASLPAYDPANPEVVAAYDKVLMQEDGKTPNLDVLTRSWEGLSAEDKAKGEYLTPSMKAAVKQKFGLSDAQIKEIGDGQIARRAAEETGYYAPVGGKDKAQAMLAWAKAGGYTEAQRQQFNEVMDGGDKAKIAEAIELLGARHAKANTGPAPRAQVTPKTDATGGTPPAANAGRVEPYASYEEYHADWKAAVAKGDQAALDKSRARWRVSDFGGKSGGRK